MKPRVEMSPTDVAEDLSTAAGIALEIHRRALRTPHAEAIVDGEVGLDYATLNVAAAGVAQELGRRGVTAGQAVAVALPRSWRLVCVMLGILRLGAQVVPSTRRAPPNAVTSSCGTPLRSPWCTSRARATRSFRRT